MEARILPDPEPTQPFDRSEWSTEDLDPRGATRRQWLMALGGVLAGGSAMSAVHCLSSGSSAGRGSKADWLDLMAVLDGEDLVHFAGLFDIKAGMQPSADPRLVPAFERLLVAAIDLRSEAADLAGQSAVRALARVQRLDVVRAQRQRCEAAGLQWTVREIDAQTGTGRERR